MSPTEQITELSEEEQQKLFDHIRSWDRAWLDTTPVDYKAVDEALVRLADYVLMDKPQVIWCQNPRQMIIMMVLYDALTNDLDDSQHRDPCAATT